MPHQTFPSHLVLCTSLPFAAIYLARARCVRTRHARLTRPNRTPHSTSPHLCDTGCACLSLDACRSTAHTRLLIRRHDDATRSLSTPHSLRLDAGSLDRPRTLEDQHGIPGKLRWTWISLPICSHSNIFSPAFLPEHAHLRLTGLLRAASGHLHFRRLYQPTETTTSALSIRPPQRRL